MQTSQNVLIDGLSWATYESFLRDYAGYSGVRLNYDRGRLEIISPGPDHEFVSSSLDTLTQAVVEEKRRDISPYGSTTFKRADIERGFEPDACYYIEKAAEMRGRTEIDLTIDPAPELVIEVDDTSPSLDKLTLYAKIGVREIWRYRKGTVTIYGLERDAYQEREHSRAFPELNGEKLAEFVAQSARCRVGNGWEWFGNG